MSYSALVNKGWLSACCHVCYAQSLPMSFDHGIVIWGTPMDLIKGPDRTQEVVDKFSKIGWLLEYQKATCPNCRTDHAKKKEAADTSFD